MLQTLERGNLFLVPLDDQRRWYRYHHLFADVLQARLLDEAPELVAAQLERVVTTRERHLVVPHDGDFLPVEAVAGKILSEQGELNAVVVGATDTKGAVPRYSTALGNAKWAILAPGGAANSGWSAARWMILSSSPRSSQTPRHCGQ